MSLGSIGAADGVGQWSRKGPSGGSAEAFSLEPDDALDRISVDLPNGFKVSATGTNAKVPPNAALLSGEAGEEGLDAHRIQPFYAGLLAKACGLAASAAMEGDAAVITAR